jgi:exodeoxyribonuclease V alpha subunit
VYRIGDKVLQLVNQPESNVFNGDMGEVIAIIKANETIDKKELLVVSYDGIEVTYERSDLNQITLSYCCSIHKSQGSEFPIVIMPIVRSQRKMLKRNLLYTGITRAQKFLILCGEPEEFKAGIARTDELSRQTTLRERLGAENELIEEIEPAARPNSESQNDPSESIEDPIDNAEDIEPNIYKLTMETFVTIDPMIGMNGITPYNLEGVD